MANLIGSRIGSFRVESLLGRGGMGEVFVGYDERLERRVALKTIRREYRLEPEARARFLQEARVLSQLEHPNICQIHDYIEGEDCDVLVLELISGSSLREALDHGLGDADPMAIAEQVAAVLVTAHGRGIVHRDLKPENIMINQRGEAKVLDFGLSRSQTAESRVARISRPMPTAAPEDDAKVTVVLAVDEPTRAQADSREDTRTRVGMILGTLGYMSPEQARGEPVTAASDLYSLGLLLQELFTGDSPIDGKLDSGELLERMRCGESRPVVGLDPELTRLIERLKSLEPSARPTAVDTAERLAWVRELPRRRRKRLAVGAVMVVLALLAAVATVQSIRATRAAVRATREAATSERVADFLVELFAVADPAESGGATLSAQELLSRGTIEIRGQLNEEPLIRARLLETMGRAHGKLGLYAEGSALLEQSLSLLEACPDADELAIASCQLELAHVIADRGDLERADALYRAALATRQAMLGDDHLGVAEVIGALGVLSLDQGDLAAAEELLQRQREIAEAALGGSDPELAKVLGNQARAAAEAGRPDDAEALLRRALEIQERVLGPDHPELAFTLANLAHQALQRRAPDEAEALYLRSLAIREAAYGPDHPLLASALVGLGVLYDHSGRLAEAEALYQRALAIREATLGPQHPLVATILNNLAGTAADTGRSVEARELYRRAVAIKRSSLGENHPDLADTLANLARFETGQGNAKEATSLLEQALAIQEAALGPEHPEVADTLMSLGDLEQAAGDSAAAEARYRRALLISEQAFGGDHPELTVALNRLGHFLVRQQRGAEARPLFERSVAIRSTSYGPGHARVAYSLVGLALAQAGEDDLKAAAASCRRALAIREAALGTDHPLVVEVRALLAEIVGASS